MMVNVAVEGASDTGAARRIVETTGHEVLGNPHVARGKGNLDPKIPKYHMAARWSPWVVFRDSDAQCPVALRAHLMDTISDRHPNFLLRIAHSMTEAWFLADTAGFADYFGVSEGKVPPNPETLPHAKQTLLRLCRDSGSRDIREGVVAADGHSTGPLFVEHLNEFALTRWDPEAAAASSDSLGRAIERLRALTA